MKSPRVQVVWKRRRNRQQLYEGTVLCLHLVTIHINHICSRQQLYLFVQTL